MNTRQTLPQGILWSKNVKSLDLDKQKTYIINQILAFGTLEHLKWLFATYDQSEIKRIFLARPMKIYQNSTFHFVKDIVLELQKTKLSSNKYVTTTPRGIR